MQTWFVSAIIGQMPQLVPLEELFKDRDFDQEAVVLCVRWYLSCRHFRSPTPISAGILRIVEQYNGRIWVESELSKGSVFRFIVPS